MERSERSVRSAQARACVGSDAPTCEDGEAGDVGEASKFPRLEKCPIIPRYRNVTLAKQGERSEHYRQETPPASPSQTSPLRGPLLSLPVPGFLILRSILFKTSCLWVN